MPTSCFGILATSTEFTDFPRGSTWKAPTVCLRYNSPFQLNHKSPNFKPPIPKKISSFGTPLLGPRPGPHQHSSFEYPGKPKPLPCFARAAEYSAFPKFSQPASGEEVVHPPAVAAPPAQTPAPAACPALSKAKQGLPVPMKTPPPRSADDGQAQALA